MRGVGGEPASELLGRCKGEEVREAMSERGALGKRMPPSSGGDWEFGSRGMGNVDTAGELNDDEGTDPEEASETEHCYQNQKNFAERRDDSPLSSQSLEAPFPDEPFDEDTDERR